MFIFSLLERNMNHVRVERITYAPACKKPTCVLSSFLESVVNKDVLKLEG